MPCICSLFILVTIFFFFFFFLPLWEILFPSTACHLGGHVSQNALSSLLLLGSGTRTENGLWWFVPKAAAWGDIHSSCYQELSFLKPACSFSSRSYLYLSNNLFLFAKRSQSVFAAYKAPHMVLLNKFSDSQQHSAYIAKENQHRREIWARRHWISSNGIGTGPRKAAMGHQPADRNQDYGIWLWACP